MAYENQCFPLKKNFCSVTRGLLITLFPALDLGPGRFICITTMPVLSISIQFKGNITVSKFQQNRSNGLGDIIIYVRQIKMRKGEQNSLNFVTSSPPSKFS